MLTGPSKAAVGGMAPFDVPVMSAPYCGTEPPFIPMRTLGIIIGNVTHYRQHAMIRTSVWLKEICVIAFGRLIGTANSREERVKIAKSDASSVRTVSDRSVVWNVQT